MLIHWIRVTQICVVKLTIIGSDNGLSPGRRQAIIWTNAGILLIGPLGTNFSEILIGIQTFSYKKMHLKMASAKWRPFCLGLNVLMKWTPAAWLARPLSASPDSHVGHSPWRVEKQSFILLAFLVLHATVYLLWWQYLRLFPIYIGQAHVRIVPINGRSHAQTPPVWKFETPTRGRDNDREFNPLRIQSRAV